MLEARHIEMDLNEFDLLAVDQDPVPSILTGGLQSFDSLIKKTPLLLSKGNIMKTMNYNFPSLVLQQMDSQSECNSPTKMDLSSTQTISLSSIDRRSSRANTIRKNLRKFLF